MEKNSQKCYVYVDFCSMYGSTQFNQSNNTHVNQKQYGIMKVCTLVNQLFSSGSFKFNIFISCISFVSDPRLHVWDLNTYVQMHYPFDFQPFHPKT